MLNIENLSVSVGQREVLKRIHLSVQAGEVHAIMGPNGSGKSTLSKVIAGDSCYHHVSGQIIYQGKPLHTLPPEERAQAGIFMSFQYPIEMPGIATIQFLKASVNAVRQAQGKSLFDAIEFLSFIREKCAQLDMDESFLYRNMNEGFSGGEKKRNEILQMLALEPQLAIFDEIDSGLDIDALRMIAQTINGMRSKQRAMILVTHYQRLLHYVEPDMVHVLVDGKIQRSGDKHLAHELEQKGYK